MRYTIKHDANNRLRVHLPMKRMTYKEADTLDYYLRSFGQITFIKVYERTAAAIAASAGIDEYYAEVLPEDKAGYIEKARAEGRRVIMVGDGINDSPALSASDAGIAISEGADIARQIADITIGSEKLESLVVLRRLSELLMKRIRFNYRTIVGFNTALIALGVAGFIPPATSAMLHNGSTVALGLNSMTHLLSEDKGETNAK